MDIQMVSYETKKIGSDILSDIDEINNYIFQLYNIFDNINASWKSEAATNYINIMKEKNLPELERLCDTLKKYGDFIKNVPNAYETLDEIFVSKGIEF